jgi:hypothetical protein
MERLEAVVPPEQTKASSPCSVTTKANPEALRGCPTAKSAAQGSLANWLGPLASLVGAVAALVRGSEPNSAWA